MSFVVVSTDFGTIRGPTRDPKTSAGKLRRKAVPEIMTWSNVMINQQSGTQEVDTKIIIK